jgi:hypothetical protein
MGKIGKGAKREKGKRIKAHDSTPPKVDYDKQPPLFSLTNICKTYCLSKCGKDEKAAFADTLHRLSQLRWCDLRQAPRHGVGYEIIPRSRLQVAIPQHVTDDVNLIAFRFCAQAPMVGYRDPINRALFHVLWLDRDFTLYDHGS